MSVFLDFSYGKADGVIMVRRRDFLLSAKLTLLLRILGVESGACLLKELEGFRIEGVLLCLGERIG